MYDVQAGGTNSQQVAAHDAPVKCVEFTEVNGTQVLVTAGWDKKLKVGLGGMRRDRTVSPTAADRRSIGTCGRQVL
jgi:hypothetical protein